jgi:hypothetical protein
MEAWLHIFLTSTLIGDVRSALITGLSVGGGEVRFSVALYTVK